MNNKHKTDSLLSLIFMVSSFTAMADNVEHTGEGTFYGYAGGGNCSFPYREDLLTAAMNKTDYDRSATCGAVIVVTAEATGRSVTVRIDDQCPECKPGDVDLDQDAFSLISPLEAGRIKIKWHFVENADAGNLKLHFKEGSSQWWAGVQVRDHRYTIASLAYRPSGSSQEFRELPRYPYNYFIAQSGMGPGPYDFRITDTHGQYLEVQSIALALESEIDLGVQFPVAEKGASNTPDVPVTDDAPVDNKADGASGSNDTDQPPADDSNESPDNSGTDVSLALETSSSWVGGYCVQAQVLNTGSKVVNWKAVFSTEGEIAYMWNAEWKQVGTQVTVEGIDWNKSLNPGDATGFGFCASMSAN